MLLRYKILLLFFIAFSQNSYSQPPLPRYPDSLFSTYYHQRASLFSLLPATKNAILFMGNSITDGGEWSELFDDITIKNRGISGDVTSGILNRLATVATEKPQKIFLMIGINDLAKGLNADSIIGNILKATTFIRQATPATRVYIESILPVNPAFKNFPNHTNKGGKINYINQQLSQLAGKNQYTFINLHDSFCDKNSNLDTAYTNDGLHLKGAGYLLWKHLVFPYVYQLNQRPDLIPAPQRVQWNAGSFPLYKCRTILVARPGLEDEAAGLQTALSAIGLRLTIRSKTTTDAPYIELKLAPAGAESSETYTLTVSADKIRITAGTAHGIFNGIQTLKQLWRDKTMIDQCVITDAPAFSWRGYMVDVGRNYMSMDLLKQQIDVMSHYKLNVFHFHATEDIAWRIAIKQYPQLTAPDNMLRNKGMYYTEQDMKDLIAYCKKRHILFVPEIDMPGHSAAFKRAMRTDMQSDSGIQYVKNILKEFCKTYDLPFIHIGADEVKITNRNFVPDMTRFIQGLGKKVIGWQPGGNFTADTWRQLWKGDGAPAGEQKGLCYIDSRHLYLNHMDPLESVVTIFNRKIGDKEKGDSSLRGATLCLWHDRAVRDERDLLTMNPVYPGMLAFAERVWNGGGSAGWIANISDGDEPAFTAFEKKLLDHKKLYFGNLPFPYVQQSQLKWILSGPYNNEGHPDRKFQPELNKQVTTASAKTVTGGTVVLRHWWAPLIKGAIDHPLENTTWYAATRIWSDEAGEKDFWIGFNNLSRSPATDSPPAGAWDNKGSKVWVNGRLVAPPEWNRPGQKGSPEIPLTDEGYEYRAPTKIVLKQGWNQVFIKLPVTTFKGKDWQNPVKWMFTFVPAD